MSLDPEIYGSPFDKCLELFRDALDFPYRFDQDFDNVVLVNDGMDVLDAYFRHNVEFDVLFRHRSAEDESAYFLAVYQ